MSMKSELSALVGTDIYEVCSGECPYFSEKHPLHVLFASSAGVLVAEKAEVTGMGENGGAMYHGSTLRVIPAEELDGYFVQGWTAN